MEMLLLQKEVKIKLHMKGNCKAKATTTTRKVHKLFFFSPLLHVLPNTLLVCFSIFGSARYAFVFAAAALLLLLLFLWHLTVGTRHK